MNFIVEANDLKSLEKLEGTISLIKSKYTFSYQSLLDKFKDTGIFDIAEFDSEEFQKITSMFGFLEIKGAKKIGKTVKSVLHLKGLEFTKISEPKFAKTKEDEFNLKVDVEKEYKQTVFELIGLNSFSPIQFSKNIKKVIVAVADTGIDYTNYKLKNNLWYDKANDSYGFNLTSANGNNFFNAYDDTSSNNKRGHGTAVTSIIGKNSVTNEGMGILPENFKILNLKVFPGYKSSFIQTCLALVFAGLMGASVINCSWGIPKIQNKPQLIKLLERVLLFLKEKNCIPVFAAMNDGKNISNLFPQKSPYVITVGSVDHLGRRAEKSNWGEAINIWAPGERIHILKAREQDSEIYKLKSGTSMAAPFVSSTIALLKAKKPSLSIDDVKKILSESGKLIEIDKAPHKVKLLNINKALIYLQENY